MKSPISIKALRKSIEDCKTILNNQTYEVHNRAGWGWIEFDSLIEDTYFICVMIDPFSMHITVESNDPNGVFVGEGLHFKKFDSSLEDTTNHCAGELDDLMNYIQLIDSLGGFVPALSRRNGE